MQLGEAYFLAGRIDEALMTLNRNLALARKRGERGHEAYGLRMLGDIAAAQPDAGATKTAETNYQAAMTLARGLGMRPLMANCELRLGLLSKRIGRKKAAEKQVIAAETTAKELGMKLLYPPVENPR